MRDHRFRMQAMIEIARILGTSSAVLLLLAVAFGARSFRNPLLQKLDGMTAFNSSQAETACQLLLAAVGLSAVAAILSVWGFFAS